MIRSFKDPATEALFMGRKHRDFANIAKTALRRLDHLQFASKLSELKEPPGNRLEALKGARAG